MYEGTKLNNVLNEKCSMSLQYRAQFSYVTNESFEFVQFGYDSSATAMYG